MWTKTIEGKFQRKSYPVQVWLDSTDENDKQVVKIQAMMNEYFLGEEIRFNDRDAACDFITHYPVEMANAFLLREAYSTGATEK